MAKDVAFWNLKCSRDQTGTNLDSQSKPYDGHQSIGIDFLQCASAVTFKDRVA